MDKDVVQVLAENYAVLRRLASHMQSSASPEARGLVFNEFARALGAHQTVIDKTVLPALKSFGWRGLSSAVLKSHVALKRSFAESLTLPHASREFQQGLEVLLVQVASQCEQEEDALLPVLQQRLDAGQRSLLAFEAEAHLTRILGEAHVVDIDLAQPVTDLVEEAHLVLGSLPSFDKRRPAPR